MFTIVCFENLYSKSSHFTWTRTQTAGSAYGVNDYLSHIECPLSLYWLNFYHAFSPYDFCFKRSLTIIAFTDASVKASHSPMRHTLYIVVIFCSMPSQIFITICLFIFLILQRFSNTLPFFSTKLMRRIFIEIIRFSLIRLLCFVS